MMTRLIAAMLAALLTGAAITVPLISDDGTAAPPVVSPQVAETTEVPTEAPPVTETVPEASKRISGDEAKTIALTHAGLSADQVKGLRAQYDLDNGIPEYDVEFRQEDWEYDYEIHAETGKILRWDREYDPVKPPAPTQPPVTETVPEASKRISGDEAKTIALTHAGLSADQVKGLRAQYDLDDGIPEYDVEFRQEDWEYDYEIHAETGKILRWDREYDPVKPPAPTQPPVTEPVPETPKKISADQAKTIALDKAGLTAGQVKGLRAQYDLDDGIPEYDVEFYADGWEYDFEIHAETGRILSWDKEWDD